MALNKFLLNLSSHNNIDCVTELHVGKNRGKLLYNTSFFTSEAPDIAPGTRMIVALPV